MKVDWKIYCVIIYLFLLSNNLQSQDCSKLDSILASKKRYILGKIYQDSLIIAEKSKVSEKIILDAFNKLNLTLEDRFYLIYNCQLRKKKRKLSFNIIEYRKDFNNQLFEGYEWTGCSNFYRCYNKAIFKIKKGKLVFVKWEM